MKQEISPKTFIAVIVVVAVIAIGVALWAWRAPSAPSVATEGVKPRPGGARAMLDQMRAERMGGKNQGQAAPQNSAP